MNGKRLMDAIGWISDRHVMEFADVQPVVVKVSPRRKILLAACILGAATLIAFSALAVVGVFNSKPPEITEPAVLTPDPTPEIVTPSPEPIDLKYVSSSYDPFFRIEEKPEMVIKNGFNSYKRFGSKTEPLITDVLGFEWPAEYCNSRKNDTYYRPVEDIYEIRDKTDGTYAEIIYSPYRDKVVGLSITWGLNNAGDGKEVPLEECRGIARSLLARKLEGLGCEAVEVGYTYAKSSRNGNAGTHKFSFELRIGGVPLHQKVTVDVDTDGRISGYNCSVIEDFTNVDGAALGAFIGSLDDTAALTAKVRELCVYDGQIDAKVAEAHLYRMQDGTCGILYKMDVSPAGEAPTGDYVMLFRPLEDY